ncbi:MAG: methyltransferase domain-containing protein [Roseburia sp.]|nr:methyltransferase domain-containing protein [Roseburia sp.]
MGYERLQEYVNSQDWSAAEQELENIRCSGQAIDDVLAILAATTYIEAGEREEAYEYIREGLKFNYKNYELYFLLGNYYELQNINQAWLCYENAEFYCESEEDLEFIRQYKTRLEEQQEWNVRNYSIVLLSYNCKDICKQCIESIRANSGSMAYELVVVDNASTDGITEWLKKQQDIKLICNAENRGFPGGCNQGIKAAAPENDILLLNNDTIVFPNAIFWLRMALYETEKTGATGSVSNYVGNDQRVEEQFDTVKQYQKYALEINIPMRHACEKKIRLIGFALMLRRRALDEAGMLDERFSPGNYEDDDLCVRLQYAGWKLLLCHNSFIYHYGQGDGQNRGSWKRIFHRNAELFKEKWGFDLGYYTNGRNQIIGQIEKDREEAISVLEIGCGMGVTLAKIEYLWPKAKTAGIESVENVARLGANYLDIIQGNIETMELPYEKESFDYIIFADVLEHLYDPEKILKKMLPYLKPDGKFLCSIPNIMHKSVLIPLLQGKFQYEDAGILDRTHVRFFTLDSIAEMFYRCGMKIENLIVSTYEKGMTTEEQELFDALCKLPHIAESGLFDAFQYIFSARQK